MIPKQKFQDYFKLKDSFFIHGRLISGDNIIHEGSEINFTINVDDLDTIYDIDIDKDFIKTYERTKEGAEEYLMDCVHNEIGVEIDVDYDEEKEWIQHPEDYVRYNALYDNGHGLEILDRTQIF